MQVFVFTYMLLSAILRLIGWCIVGIFKVICYMVSFIYAVTSDLLKDRKQ